MLGSDRDERDLQGRLRTQPSCLTQWLEDLIEGENGTSARCAARFVGKILSFTGLSVSLVAASPNVVLDWNAVMMAAVRLDNSGPTLSSRNLAILHAAIYDAVNSVVRSHQRYQFQFDAPPNTSIEAAAAGAGYEILKTLYPGLRSHADATFDAWRTTTPDDAQTRNGLELGNRVAQLTLASRSGDGSATDFPYIPSDAPGAWRRTPPFFRPPVTPGWRYVKPFAVGDISPLVPPPPPALSSEEYAESLNEVKRLGNRNSESRTTEQALIAVFWSDFSYTSMPPGHWHEIAASIARARRLSVPQTARLMALLSLAQADSAIVCWEAKYRYNLWRPITAIQRAAEDGNPATESDLGWDHLLAAPPFPSYTSGHSTFSKASAEVLAFFFGSDAIEFDATSDSLPGVVRQFHSLAACADEVGQSRIYGGIHFPFDNREGKSTGARVARTVTANWLLPNDELPFVRLEGLQSGLTTIRVHGPISEELILEQSEDLSEWRLIRETKGAPGGALFSFTTPSESRCFFRARIQP